MSVCQFFCLWLLFNLHRKNFMSFVLRQVIDKCADFPFFSNLNKNRYKPFLFMFFITSDPKQCAPVYGNHPVYRLLLVWPTFLTYMFLQWRKYTGSHFRYLFGGSDATQITHTYSGFMSDPFNVPLTSRVLCSVAVQLQNAEFANPALWLFYSVDTLPEKRRIATGL